MSQWTSREGDSSPVRLAACRRTVQSDQCVLRVLTLLRVTGSQTAGDVFVRHLSGVCGHKRHDQRGSLVARMHESHFDSVIRCSHTELGTVRMQEIQEFEIGSWVYC